MPPDIEEVMEMFHGFAPILLDQQDDLLHHQPVAKSYIFKCTLGDGSCCKLIIGSYSARIEFMPSACHEVFAILD